MAEAQKRTRWLYGMRLRGFSLGCQPMQGLAERRDSDSRRYYDILVYTRKLEEWEVNSFELDFIGTEEV